MQKKSRLALRVHQSSACRFANATVLTFKTAEFRHHSTSPDDNHPHPSPAIARAFTHKIASQRLIEKIVQVFFSLVACLREQEKVLNLSNIAP